MKSILLFLFLFVYAASAADVVAPRVLILGDSIYNNPTQIAAKELKGRVELVYAKTNPGESLHTGISLERLDELLGKSKLDLIHFNFGLGDLVYKLPGIKSIRVLPKDAGGVRVTSPEQYEKNLQAIVTRLKATGAKLVWASTTPITGSPNNLFDVDSEIEYNAIAAKIMTKENVPINDMHAYVISQMQPLKNKGRGSDPFVFDRSISLHPPLIAIILNQLGLK
jgi:hypothetical protein